MGLAGSEKSDEMFNHFDTTHGMWLTDRQTDKLTNRIPIIIDISSMQSTAMQTQYNVCCQYLYNEIVNN